LRALDDRDTSVALWQQNLNFRPLPQGHGIATDTMATFIGNHGPVRLVATNRNDFVISPGEEVSEAWFEAMPSAASALRIRSSVIMKRSRL
jgi:hypothetical protein